MLRLCMLHAHGSIATVNLRPSPALIQRLIRICLAISQCKPFCSDATSALRSVVNAHLLSPCPPPCEVPARVQSIEKGARLRRRLITRAGARYRGSHVIRNCIRCPRAGRTLRQSHEKAPHSDSVQRLCAFTNGRGDSARPIWWPPSD